MAARSSVIIFNNQTPQNLTLSAQGLSHGIWATPPPPNIGPNGSATFEADSDGFMTGVQGTVTYQAAGSQAINLDFDNPFVGSSSYSGGAAVEYALSTSVNGGNNATVTYTLNVSSWMQENLGSLGSRPLRHLCIPGSHDSGMSTFVSGTVGAAPCNTVAQVTGILGQLQLGIRYFDVRPVISGDQFLTGHYTNTNNSVLGWQGANGQSIASIINDVNTYTAANQELVILYLSHDLDTDVGEPSYSPFTQGDWNNLLEQLTGLNHLFVAPNPASVDLTMLTLRSYIGSQAAVVVVVDPSDSSITLGNYATQGFYTPGNFSVFNQYSDTNDLGAMESDQLNKLSTQRPTPDAGYFLLSWTLTQDDTEAATCSSVPGTSSILDLAAVANPALPGALLPACSAQTYPNIILIDGVSSFDVTTVAMAVNNKAISG